MFRMIKQLWNTNTQTMVSYDADLTENYMYIQGSSYQATWAT